MSNTGMPLGEISLHLSNSVCIIDDFEAECYLASIDLLFIVHANLLSVVNSVGYFSQNRELTSKSILNIKEGVISSLPHTSPTWL